MAYIKKTLINIETGATTIFGVQTNRNFFFKHDLTFVYF